MARNERTSKKVASTAGKLLSDLEQASHDIAQIRVYMAYVADTLVRAKSVVASALTQAPDRKKRKKQAVGR